MLLILLEGRKAGFLQDARITMEIQIYPSSNMNSDLIDAEVVDDQPELISIVEELSKSDIYAIDTEFHRRKPTLQSLPLSNCDGVTAW